MQTCIDNGVPEAALDATTCPLPDMCKVSEGADPKCVPTYTGGTGTCAVKVELVEPPERVGDFGYPVIDCCSPQPPSPPPAPPVSDLWPCPREAAAMSGLPFSPAFPASNVIDATFSGGVPISGARELEGPPTSRVRHCSRLL